MPDMMLSPGYAASSELADILMRQEVLKRQAFLDSLESKRVEAEIADHAQNRKIQQQNADALETYRKAEAADKETGDVLKIADRTKIGTQLDPGMAARMGKVDPSLVASKPVPGTIPGASFDDAAATKPAAPVPTFAGTAGQQREAGGLAALEKILGDPNVPEATKTAIKAITAAKQAGVTLPESALAGGQNEPVYRVNPRTGKVEQIGDAPKGSHFVNEPKEPGEDGALSLDQAGLDMAAKMYSKTGQLPPMGMGAAGAAVRTKVINRAAQYDAATDSFKAPVKGGPPAPIPDIAGNSADFKSNSAALLQIQKSLSAATAFADTAKKNTELLKAVIATVPDTGIPLLNTSVRLIDAKVFGDKNMAALNAIRQSVQNEYARIISQPNLTGVLSDSARHEAETILSADSTPQQMLEALKTLEKEAENRQSSYEEQIQAIRTRIRGITPGVVDQSKKSKYSVTIER